METNPDLRHWHAVSYLAPNMFSLYRAICDGVERALNGSIDLRQAEHDSLDDPRLAAGHVDLAFVCGLPLVRLNRRQPETLIPAVAPIPADPRSGGQPVYFADFIVHADSPYWALDDVAGTTFAYNDPGSNSGYHLPRSFLHKRGVPSAFFGRAIPTGSHQQSVRWIAERRADCAAIDSTVLAQIRRDAPDRAAQIRVIASTDACPIPPFALSSALKNTIPLIQGALTTDDARLKHALTRANMAGLAAVALSHYTVVGTMFDTVEAAGYALARSI